MNSTSTLMICRVSSLLPSLSRKKYRITFDAFSEMYTETSEIDTVKGYHRLPTQSLAENSLTCLNAPRIGLGSSVTGRAFRRLPNLNMSTRLKTISARYLAEKATVKPAKGSLKYRIIMPEMTKKTASPTMVEWKLNLCSCLMLMIPFGQAAWLPLTKLDTESSPHAVSM